MTSSISWFVIHFLKKDSALQILRTTTNYVANDLQEAFTIHDILYVFFNNSIVNTVFELYSTLWLWAFPFALQYSYVRVFLDWVSRHFYKGWLLPILLITHLSIIDSKSFLFFDTPLWLPKLNASSRYLLSSSLLISVRGYEDPLERWDFIFDQGGWFLKMNSNSVMYLHWELYTNWESFSALSTFEKSSSKVSKTLQFLAASKDDGSKLNAEGGIFFGGDLMTFLQILMRFTGNQQFSTKWGIEGSLMTVGLLSECLYLLSNSNLRSGL